jgi:outer membrane protein insertion porin family
MKRCLLLLAILLLGVVPLRAAESFIISDIRIEGLQRISAGSIFAALPINVGDTVDDVSVRNAIRNLFRSGNFDDVQVFRDGGILVVSVAERPSISAINIEGNKAIETEMLVDGLNGAGLSEGKVFKRSTLEGMSQELTRQYVSQGRYDASVETEVVELARNRVEINITIDEGTSASISHINVVGNTVFEEEDLVDLFELRESHFTSFFSGDDKYAKEKLSGDLETLSSYYLDRGYINFNLDSTQVSVSPDRENVYITANITEGEQFTVGEVGLSGELVMPEATLKQFVLVRSGQVFSQALITNTEELLVRVLGNKGYNFAKIEGCR